MSANNVVLCMKYEGSYHVFYSGCADNDPKEPDYDNEYYKNFMDRIKALIYAHDTVNEIDKECNDVGFSGVEYGVMEISVVKPLSNAKGVSSELIKSVGELQFKVGEVEKTVGILSKHANSVHALSVGNRAIIVELKEEVKILGDVEDGQWAEMYNLREFLRELFQRMGDNENLSRLGYDLLGKINSLKQTEKIPIGDDLMKRIMSHKSVPMDKMEKKEYEYNLPENYYTCKKFNEQEEWCDCDACKKEREASGGEKGSHPLVNQLVQKVAKGINDDSKLPEEIMFPGIYGYIKAEPDSEYKRGFTHGYEDGKKCSNEKFQSDLLSIFEEPELSGVRLLCNQYIEECGGEIKTETKKAVESQRKDYNRLLVTCSKCSYKWLVNIEHVQKDQQEEDYKKFYEDILACRGMCYKEMVNYLVELEEKYDEE